MGRITAQLVSSFTSLDSTASLHTNNNMFSSLFKSNLVKLETGNTVIILPTVSVLWINLLKREKLFVKAENDHFDLTSYLPNIFFKFSLSISVFRGFNFKRVEQYFCTTERGLRRRRCLKRKVVRYHLVVDSNPFAADFI